MAHEVETMAWAGEVPWHGLGKEVPADLSPEQMLKAAGLDWKVYQVPAYAKVNGKNIAVDRSVLVRDDTHKVLTVTSEDWNPNQNEEAFKFFDEFIKAGSMQMHTAGSLKGGQIVWALAKVNESFELFGTDRVDSFLLFTNPHVFGKAIDIRFTPIRVVCNNTLTLSLQGKMDNLYKVSHRAVFDPVIAKDYLGIASEKMLAYKEKAEYLGSRRFTKETLLDYFKTVFPNNTENSEYVGKLSKNAKLATTFVDTQPGAEFARGSWWQAFNTVTFMLDHVIGRTADNRLYSAWYGQGKNKKIEAMDTAIEFATAA